MVQGRCAGVRVCDCGRRSVRWRTAAATRVNPSVDWSDANRLRFCLEVVDAVRAVWPERSPLFVRISATDWKEGGWDIEQAVELARRLRAHGVDLIDCASSGAVADATVPFAPGYQVPFAERIRREAGVATGAVGLIMICACGRSWLKTTP
jgi:2,4-dienoyl-CoA reductase-like NADH-dependent reductase (Old Yellow Enzyme family)